MTVQLTLPKDVEERLLAEVRAGHHATLEEAILSKIAEADDFSSIGGMTPDALRQDLNDAWHNRQGAMSAKNVFDRLAAKSASLKSQGK